MAYALSVDAQEFIPGELLDPKTTLCNSLSVDAAVFVPFKTVMDQKENCSTAAVGSKENKSSNANVPRRGRFAQTDSRTSNQKNIDIFGKNPTLNKKENNSAKCLKQQPGTNHAGSKHLYFSREGDKKNLKQSFSLEYSKRQKQVTPTATREPEKKIQDLDVQADKITIQTCNSGESKPIILWSSIVKQEPPKGISDFENIAQKTNSNLVEQENAACLKKYSKNKVTRTKNVLSEPPMQKFGQGVTNKWKSKCSYEEELSTNKLLPNEFTSKFVTPSGELLNASNKNEDIGTESTNITHRYSSVVVKDIRIRDEKEAEEKSITGEKLERIHNNLPVKKCDAEFSRKVKCETELSMNVIPNDLKPSKVKTPKKNNSKEITKKTPKEQVENKGNFRDMKSFNKAKESDTNDGINKIQSNTSDNQSDTKKPEKGEPEKLKLEPLMNLSDNADFPTLAGKSNTRASIPPLSYSAVAKRIIAPTINTTPDKRDKTVDVAHDITSEDQKRILKKRQKALKRKLKVKQKKEEAKSGKPKPKQVSERKTEEEVTLNLSDIFTKLLKMPGEKSKAIKTKKVKISTGVISVVSGLAKKNMPDGRRLERNKYGTTHTLMDGTSIRKRGKERETPKRKRPTLLKKVITAERERKRLLLEKSKITEIEVSKEVQSEEPPCEEGEGTNNIERGEKVDYINKLPEAVWQKIHSKKFREYCDHILTKDINNFTYNLLSTLQKFQDRVYHENPAKYKQKRRFILGLREVLKHLKLKRLKAVVIAPNLERISSKGGLDDYLDSIISICNELEIPKIFAMNRHVLGRVIKKLAPVSVVGIFDYDGAQDIFHELLEHVQLAKVAYTEKINELCKESSEEAVGSILFDSIDAQEDIGQNSGTANVTQQILTKLYIDEYVSYDPESESDAWITDTEGVTF